MNQEKIGKFIAYCRKEQKLTQSQLGEKLNVTYKAVSKWECGKGLPDAAIMIDLCAILKITVNELLCGEKVQESDYMTRAENNFVNLKKKVDRVIKIINIMGWIIAAIMISLSVIHTYYNWLYREPWDDSNFRVISNVLLLVSAIGFLITTALQYEAKK